MFNYNPVFLGLTLLLACVYGLNNNHQTRSTDVNIYFLGDSYIQAGITLPSQYQTKYQISAQCSSPTFKVVSGGTANVTSSGLVAPKGTTWYWKGNMGTTAYMPDADRVTVEYKTGVTTIKATCDGSSQEYKVNVTDYSNIYADNKINTILSEIITKGLTPLQKLQNITRWVGRNTDYCTSYQSYKAMVIFECGDCWASTNTIVEMCTRVGIEAWGRRGNQDPLAGSGHRNAIAYIDGKYYIAEAGYSGKKPRGANVKEEPYGLSVSGSIIYQYDGKNTTVVLPSEINGVNMTTLGKNNATVFVNAKLESLHIPASIVNYGRGALYDTPTLKTITVDPKNEGLEAVKNVLYTKNRTTLLYVPTSTKSLTIDKKTTHIGYTAIAYCDLDTLVIPGSVNSTDYAILYKSEVKRLKIENGFDGVGETVFQSLTAPQVVLPDSVTTMGLAPFYYANVTKVALPNSVTEIPMGCFQSSTVHFVRVPRKLEVIGEKAFYGCSQLKNITLPSTLTTVKSNAFSKSLTDIFFTGSEEQWKKVTFETPLTNDTTVHYNAEWDYGDFEDYVDFPGWAVFVCCVGVVVGAGIVAGTVAVAITLARKKNDTGGASPSSVEIGAANSSKKTAPAAKPAAKPTAPPPAKPTAPSRPAPSGPPPTTKPRPAPRPPATQPRPAPRPAARAAPPPPPRR